MSYNWGRIYNRLFQLVDQAGDCYFSGPKFIDCVREVDPYFPNYGMYMDQLKSSGSSTSRRDYFHTALMSFDEPERVRIVNAVLDCVRTYDPDKVAGVESEMGGVAAVPRPEIGEFWNAERLTKYLSEIDSCIVGSNYGRAISLSYSCLEGFLKAFCKEKIPGASGLTEIVALTKAVRTNLKEVASEYPDEVLSMLSHICHTVDRSRNRFSESHFDSEASRWLAVFIRDLVNTEIRLLLHFMNPRNLRKAERDSGSAG